MATLNIEQLKSETHRVLISKLDLEKLSRVNSQQARQAVASMVSQIIGDQKVPLSRDEQDRLQADLLDEGARAKVLRALESRCCEMSRSRKFW